MEVGVRDRSGGGDTTCCFLALIDGLSPEATPELPAVSGSEALISTLDLGVAR